MIFISAVCALVLIWCCSAGLSSARSVQSPETAAENAVGVTQVRPTSDLVQCEVPGCEYDLQLYCLANGVIVMGSCSLKNTLCENGRRNTLKMADDWNACFMATYTIQYSGQVQEGPGEAQDAEEMGEETGNSLLGDSDVADLFNLQLEQELSRAAGKDKEVRADAGSGDIP